jgi:hypothetical protein
MIGKQVYKTPGNPRFIIQQSTKTWEFLIQIIKINIILESECYLLDENLLPDISIVVRELSKSMDGATWSAYLEILHVTEFIINTKDLGLKN